jgi:hypothetical protein
MEGRQRIRGVGVSIFVIILTLTAGCLITSSSSQESATPPTIEREATDVAGTTVPELPDVDAKEQALSAEKTFLSEYLQEKSCLDEWGFSAPVVSKKAVIRNRTANTVVVAVRHPFWYSTGNSHGDTYSTAIYFVTMETAERERQSGPQVC